MLPLWSCKESDTLNNGIPFQLPGCLQLCSYLCFEIQIIPHNRNNILCKRKTSGLSKPVHSLSKVITVPSDKTLRGGKFPQSAADVFSYHHAASGKNEARTTAHTGLSTSLRCACAETPPSTVRKMLDLQKQPEA